MARLYSSPDFQRRLNEQFEGEFKLHFHLAAPIIARRDLDTGKLEKREFGSWILNVFHLLKHFKFLRGTAFDPFGLTAERRQERRLIGDYEATIEQLLQGLSPEKMALAVQIAEIPEHIRGFGHVKERHIEDAKANEGVLLKQFHSDLEEKVAAE